ncbi:MAG: endolytic transglycosylase MltG [Oscillospiraceae bacterium]|nr:endolytic transglycosylase MltG [Oscillospiraceae bacterium]
MADELMPRQDGVNEPETETPAEEILTETEEAAEALLTDAEPAEDAAAAAAEAEDTLQKALDAMDEVPDVSDEVPDADPDEAAAESGISKGDALKEKAANIAGKLKEGAGKLSDDIKKTAKKKKAAAKKNKPKRTFEEEMADLAEEEKHFDEWGRPIRKKHRRRKKTRKLSCTLVLLTLILAMSSVLSVAILAVAKEMYGIDKDVQERIIVIPDGSTTQSIADQLVDEHMISLPPFFRLVSRMNGYDGKYIAGEHVLAASMSYEDMIKELCKNHADERETQRVRFREGTTLVDAAKALQENQICDAEKFLFYFNKGGYGFKFEEYLPEKNPMKWQQMEGYCFPDTYEFYVDEEPNIVAQKIYANFDSKLSDGDYKKMDELGMTLDEVITLASMVQAEASRIDYMKMVASVFRNRLLNKSVFPKLESDPTRKYADLIASNLEINNDMMTTAYNTYKGPGLPPGAINNPGKEAIEAVLYPAQTNYYFFNSNINTGDTYFAETLEKHEQNLAMVNAQYAAEKAAANGES